MKTSARFLAMILAVVMLAGSALTVSAFSDVKAGTEHAKAINVLSQLDVIGGYEDGTFAPEKAVSRAEMAKLCFVLYTTFVNAGQGTKTFDDVAVDNWASGYISWCAGMDIIGGYGDGNFGPSDNVTYDQALKMVCGVLGYNDWDSDLWPTDVRTKALTELELGNDIPVTVNGSDALTRGQVAQIMYNALNAPMKETKNVWTEIDNNGNKVQLLIPVAKKLIIDTWKFAEKTYVVDYDSNLDDDEIKLGTRTFDLEDLGLEALEGNVQDYDGIEVTVLVGYKDGTTVFTDANLDWKDKVFPAATIEGTFAITDKISYSADLKTITIDDVDYTLDDLYTSEIDAKVPATEDADDYVKFFYGDNAWNNGTWSEVFVNDKKDDDHATRTTAVKAFLENPSYARVVDKDGDGDAEYITLYQKAAYEVTGFKKASNKDYMKYETLDGTTDEILVSKVMDTYAKKDIIVGAVVNGKLYAEKVEPVATYATKISGTAATSFKANFNGVDGTIKYGISAGIIGVADNNLTKSLLGSSNVYNYYIYADRLIYSDAIATDYSVVILKNVELVEDQLNTESMTEEDYYVATLTIDGVDTKLTLDKTVAATINGTDLTPAQLYATYASETFDDNGVDRVLYHYEIVADYEENTDGYTLYINHNKDNTLYTLVSNATLAYNSKTGLYTVSGTNLADNTAFSTSKIELDDSSVIFYRYAKTAPSASGNFMYLGTYTKANITSKTFGAVPAFESSVVYLKENSDGLYTLVAMLLNSTYTTQSNAPTYKNDSSFLLYAPEASSVLAESGKNYNSYVFMDNATLENTIEIVDRENEIAQGSSGANVAAGGIYFLNNDAYVQMNSTLVAGDNTIRSIEYGIIRDVITKNSYVEYQLNGNGVKKIASIGSDVKIWGLAETDKSDVYAQYDFDDLKTMFDLVEDFNEAELERITALNTDSDPTNDEVYSELEIEVLALSTEDSDNTMVVNTLIVEIFATSEAGNVISVNDLIFDKYMGR